MKFDLLIISQTYSVISTNYNCFKTIFNCTTLKFIKILKLYSNLHCTKQWPLAGKFVEFEYSPKIRQFGEFEYSPKCSFLENGSDSIHSPDIRQPFSPDSIHSPDIRQPFSPDSIHSTDIRQPFSPHSIHSPGKANVLNVSNVSSLANFALFGELNVIWRVNRMKQLTKSSSFPNYLQKLF
jgi:hypothetical protein